MTQFDLLILSPGVPPGLPFIEEAKAAGAEIIGELEIAYRVGYGSNTWQLPELTAKRQQRH